MKRINSISKYLLVIALFFVGLHAIAQVDLIYRDINAALKNPDNVYQLNLSGNKVNRHLKHIKEFKNLESLNLSFCELTEFPTEITQCKNLVYLNLSSNSIKRVPESISNLKNLEYLFLGYNDIKSLPPTIGHCRWLKEIDLSSNYQLEALPSQLKELESLEVLTCRIATNEFQTILCHLLKLKELTIYSNSSDLVCDLVQMKELVRFNLILIEAEFTPFNCSMSDLTNLKHFQIEKLDCCWPYINVSSELLHSIKAQLPEDCNLSGFYTGIGIEIRSDIELR